MNILVINVIVISFLYINCDARLFISQDTKILKFMLQLYMFSVKGSKNDISFYLEFFTLMATKAIRFTVVLEDIELTQQRRHSPCSWRV